MTKKELEKEVADLRKLVMELQGSLLALSLRVPLTFMPQPVTVPSIPYNPPYSPTYPTIPYIGDPMPGTPGYPIITCGTASSDQSRQNTQSLM